MPIAIRVINVLGMWDEFLNSLNSLQLRWAAVHKCQQRIILSVVCRLLASLVSPYAQVLQISL
ncbi:hypothetical protein BDV23DRAFT_17188 [Aspergillus alliaceus]|uniref:Uncharacterized protein n=1 Tax=Petromyces alliaceus TaxID=209559 RepID=A0A5N7CKE4_PETAA|nr:hypothetical protein BDV23DRAFT_17188 [Aspergillus alliaceus]